MASLIGPNAIILGSARPTSGIILREVLSDFKCHSAGGFCYLEVLICGRPWLVQSVSLMAGFADFKRQIAVAFG